MKSVDIVNSIFRGKVSLIHREAMIHLLDMAQSAPVGTLVEIGVYKGSSLAGMALARRKMGQVIGVDDWSYDSTSAEYVYKFLDNYEVQAELFSMTSAEAAEVIPGPLAFIHIDGNHTYDYVKQDIELWTPKLMSGGIIAFHDYGRNRADIHVKRAVDEWQAREPWQNLGEVLTTIGFRKP